VQKTKQTKLHGNLTEATNSAASGSNCFSLMFDGQGLDKHKPLFITKFISKSMKQKSLGLFQLVMINVIAVDSIRTLTFSAVYGFSLVFSMRWQPFFSFFQPLWISAELGTRWPNRGGIYVWVREAFGKKLSLVIIWLNWLYNIIWYPTILALIAELCLLF